MENKKIIGIGIGLLAVLLIAVFAVSPLGDAIFRFRNIGTTPTCMESIEYTQEEYTSETYKVFTKTYSVSVLIVADDGSYAKFKVNGETTANLKAGSQYKLSDGSLIVVKNIYPAEGTAKDKVTFSFKAC